MSFTPQRLLRAADTVREVAPAVHSGHWKPTDA